MKMKVVSILCSLLLLVGALPVWAAPITTLFNTGVDDNGQLLPAGPDSHYSIIAVGQAFSTDGGGFPVIQPLDPSYTVALPRIPVVAENPPLWAWVANGPTSNWIGPRAGINYGCGDSAGVDDRDNYIGSGIWIYQTAFDLTGLNPQTVLITGLWGTDDPGWMYLNLPDPTVFDPAHLVVSGGGFSVLPPFEISGANGLFRPGLNTLTFVVWDAGNCVTGLRMDIQSATAEPAQCVQPPASMIGWWPGDGNAHDIVNANNGTLNNGAVIGSGLVGQAFSFDFSGGFVRIANHPSLNTPDGLTVDAWVYPTSQGGAEVIASKWDDPTGQWSWIFKRHNDGSGRLRIEISSGDHNALGDLGGVTALPLNTWSHVAATFDRATGQIRLYVNGTLDSEGLANFPGVGISNSATDLLIGAVNGQTTPPGEFFHGSIDELELFNRALTAEEIQSIYFAGSVGKCRELAVTIDITPGGFPNSINPAGRGVIPVAVLTTGTFNAALVDAPTVRFGATGTEAAPVHFALEDVDLDGDLDLILQFTTLQTGIVCGTTSATLTGMTIDGVAITGTDSVNTVGCR